MATITAGETQASELLRSEVITLELHLFHDIDSDELLERLLTSASEAAQRAGVDVNYATGRHMANPLHT